MQEHLTESLALKLAASDALKIPTVKAIRKGFVVMFDGAHRGGYCYEDPTTERSFQIRKCEHLDERGREKIKFFLEEFVPNGRMVRFDETDHRRESWDEPAIAELENSIGPNGLIKALRARGIDVELMCKTGGGFGVGTIYFDTLEACAQAIHSALQGNVRYKYFRELSAQEKLRNSRRNAIGRHAYLERRLREIEGAEQAGSGLFKGCHDGLGRPLARDTQRKILAYINKPSQEKWLETRNYLIAGCTTLWQAWIAIDPNAPRQGVDGYPSAAQVRRMIPQAVETQRQEIEARLKRSSPTGLRAIAGARK
jgi:hypothetical protein